MKYSIAIHMYTKCLMYQPTTTFWYLQNLQFYFIQLSLCLLIVIL